MTTATHWLLSLILAAGVSNPADVPTGEVPIVAGLSVPASDFLGQPLPGITPMWFAAEEVSQGLGERSLVFSPDLAEAYFQHRDEGSGATDFWVAERSGSDWSDPQRLTAPINSGARDEDLSVARDGTIYFSSDRSGGYDIYRAPLVDGAYAAVERLSTAVNSVHFDGHPCIEPIP